MQTAITNQFDTMCNICKIQITCRREIVPEEQTKIFIDLEQDKYAVMQYVKMKSLDKSLFLLQTSRWHLPS